MRGNLTGAEELMEENLPEWKMNRPRSVRPSYWRSSVMEKGYGEEGAGALWKVYPVLHFTSTRPPCSLKRSAVLHGRF